MNFVLIYVLLRLYKEKTNYHFNINQNLKKTFKLLKNNIYNKIYGKYIWVSPYKKDKKMIKERYYKLNLTLVNRSKERSTIFPLVIVNLFCDLTMRSSTVRLSLAGKSYQRESYAAFPIILLWKRKNMKYVRDIRKLMKLPFFSLNADLGAQIFAGKTVYKCLEINRDVE